ncbi:MAG: hypothetical protein ACJ72A_13420, partial [Nocardioidaceae bacterium]
SRVSSTDKAVTVMVDLTRDAEGCLHARLLDAVQGRSGRVYAEWLRERGVESPSPSSTPPSTLPRLHERDP